MFGGQLFIKNCTFYKNSAKLKNGGGVFIQDAAQSLVVLDEGNIFMANYAAVRGSAMYCDKIL